MAKYSPSQTGKVPEGRIGLITSAEGWLFGFAPSIVYALSLPVPQSHIPTQKRGCDKMCNHFAKVLFVLAYSISGLSNTFIYWLIGHFVLFL